MFRHSTIALSYCFLTYSTFGVFLIDQTIAYGKMDYDFTNERVERFLEYCGTKEMRYNQGVHFEYSAIGLSTRYQMLGSEFGELLEYQVLNPETNETERFIKARNPRTEFIVQRSLNNDNWILREIREFNGEQFPYHFQHLRAAKSPWCLETISVNEVVSRRYVQRISSTHDKATGITELFLKYDRPNSSNETLVEKLPFLSDSGTVKVYFEETSKDEFRIVRVAYRNGIDGVQASDVIDNIRYLDGGKYVFEKSYQGKNVMQLEFTAHFDVKFAKSAELELEFYDINIPGHGGSVKISNWYWYLAIAIILVTIALYLRNKSR